jgi:hypothetical protein
VQDGRAAEASMREVGHGSVGLRHRIGGGRGSDGEPCGESQELLSIGSGIRRHTAQSPFVKELVLVVKNRNVAEPDPGHGESATWGECTHRDRDELAGELAILFTAGEHVHAHAEMER